jgi:signal peptidase I
MVWDFAAVLAADSWVLAPARRRAGGVTSGAVDKPPLVVEYARSFFPIFVIVLLLRSFLVEPFRIPSGSMIPTLLVGDFILVNKFTYGIRLPVLNLKVFELGAPTRGDVVVFRYPLDPSTPFIKRVVGLPGDTVRYLDKNVYINGEKVGLIPEGTYVGVRSAVQHTGAKLMLERLGTVEHRVILSPGMPTVDGEFAVPAGHYFVLGDSRDSRFWGYVPDANLIGRAFFIWMNWDGGPDLRRIGTTIN